MHVSWRLKEFKRRLSQQNEDGRIHAIKLMSSVTETKVGQSRGSETEGDVLFNSHTFSFY